MSRYYKIKIEGELKKILDDITKKRKKFFKEAKAIANEVGANFKKDCYGDLERGHLYALCFDAPPDAKVWKLWRRDKDSNAYCPKLSSKAGKELDKRFDSLTKVDYTPLWDHINWAKDQFIGNRIIFSPGVAHSKDNKFLLFVFDNEVKYKPIEGMTAITWEEYEKRGGEE